MKIKRYLNLFFLFLAFFSMNAIFLNLKLAAQTEENDVQVEDAQLIKNGMTMTVVQRETVTIASSDDEELAITIGDITGGRVSVSIIERKEGKTVLPFQYMRSGEIVSFHHNSVTYKLHLKRLQNFIVGDDKAYFQIYNKGNRPPLTTEEEVEKLLQHLSELKGAVLVRNGEVYSVKNGVSHLIFKAQAFNSEINSSEDFINLIASKSDSSGELYMIHFVDASESISLNEWLHQCLGQIRTNWSTECR